MKRGSSIGAPHIVQIATGCDGQPIFQIYCRIDEADHSRKARLTSTNVTTARTRAPSPSTAICGVTADKKSMAAKPNPQNSIRNGPKAESGSHLVTTGSHPQEAMCRSDIAEAEETISPDPFRPPSAS